MYNDDDFCSLDPAKLCDNCCKCLEAHDAYRILHADMHITGIYQSSEEEEVPEEYGLMQQLPFEEDTLWAEEEENSGFPYEEDGEEEAYDFGKNLPPLEIDPALLAHWEAKLADIGKSEQEIPNLYGMRQRRRRP